jgi:hypothetical protein
MTAAILTVGGGGADAEATRRSHPALAALSSAPTTAINFRDFQVLASVLICSFPPRAPRLGADRAEAVVFHKKFAKAI